MIEHHSPLASGPMSPYRYFLTSGILPLLPRFS